MAGDSVLESEEENILYDLLINTEWPQETDTQLRGNKEQNTSAITKALTGPLRLILHYLWYSPSSSSLPAGLVRLVSKQINWQLVLASNGKLLAVVQDQAVEIRSARDDFGSVIGKCQAHTWEVIVPLLPHDVVEKLENGHSFNGCFEHSEDRGDHTTPTAVVGLPSAWRPSYGEDPMG